MSRYMLPPYDNYVDSDAAFEQMRDDIQTYEGCHLVDILGEFVDAPKMSVDMSKVLEFIQSVPNVCVWQGSENTVFPFSRYIVSENGKFFVEDGGLMFGDSNGAIEVQLMDHIRTW